MSIFVDIFQVIWVQITLFMKIYWYLLEKFVNNFLPLNYKYILINFTNICQQPLKKVNENFEFLKNYIN